MSLNSHFYQVFTMYIYNIHPQIIQLDQLNGIQSIKYSPCTSALRIPSITITLLFFLLIMGQFGQQTNLYLLLQFRSNIQEKSKNLFGIRYLLFFPSPEYNLRSFPLSAIHLQIKALIGFENKIIIYLIRKTIH